MSAARRLGATLAAVGALASGLSTVVYARGPAARALSDAAAELGARVGAAELTWSGAHRGRPPANAERTRRELARPRALLFGAHDDGLPDSMSGVLSLERALGEPMLLVQLYVAWGDGREHAFPVRAARAIWAAGSVPVITWEPWLGAFDGDDHARLRAPSERDHRGLSDIASGKYDFYVDAWASAAASFDKPLFVRFAHEMNDSYRYPWGPHHNPEPTDFVRAFRHVVARFRAAGAHQVLWVWAPSVAYDGYENRFPGTDVVDWVGTGVLNYGTSARWSAWQSAQEILRPHYPRLASYGKPVMIAELGSLSAGGDRALWYEETLAALPVVFPKLRALLFFHVKSDRTVTNQPLRWSFADDAVESAAARRGISRGRGLLDPRFPSSQGGVR